MKLLRTNFNIWLGWFMNSGMENWYQEMKNQRGDNFDDKGLPCLFKSLPSFSRLEELSLTFKFTIELLVKSTSYSGDLLTENAAMQILLNLRGRPLVNTIKIDLR